MNTVPMRTALADLWADMTAAQKFVTVALAMLVVVLMVSGWVDSLHSWQQLRVYENAAIAADRDKVEALEKAAKIAGERQKQEEENRKIEEQINAIKAKAEPDRRQMERDLADYQRAVTARRSVAPSATELCAELERAGHPCR